MVPHRFRIFFFFLLDKYRAGFIAHTFTYNFTTTKNKFT